MKIVISSGHGLLVRGASAFIDEVDEARRVVEKVADYMRDAGAEVVTFHDDLSTTQDENLQTIVDFHNGCDRDIDVSVHFNAFEVTDEPRGTEVLYVGSEQLATDVAAAIAKSGLFNRGAKYRNDLYFLNNTEAPAILIEICFVDSKADTNLYTKKFNVICRLIAWSICGPEYRGPLPSNQRDIIASVFGGEEDYNVSAYDEDRVLNDSDLYVALPDRFEGERPDVIVINRETGNSAVAAIEDVGPWNIDDPYWITGTRPQAESGTDESGRVTNGAGIDLSPALAKIIGIDGMGLVDWDFVEGDHAAVA